MQSMLPYTDLRHKVAFEDGSLRNLAFRATRRLVRLYSPMWCEGEECLVGVKKHATALEILNFVGGDIFDDYFKFSVVRNPYSWLISHFEYVKRKKGHPRSKQVGEMTFSQFLADLMKRGALTQTGFLEIDGSISMDLVCRQERLDIDMADVYSACDIPPISLQRSNASQTSSSELAQLIGIEDVRAINHYFREDFENFGYALRK